MSDGSASTAVTRNRNFMLLWVSQSISRVGTTVTQLAIPLTAALLLQGTPFQVSMVTVVEFLPAIVFGPAAGVFVDRLDQRKILIWTDIIRFFSLGSIPACYLLGVLNFPILYAATCVTGLLSIVYDTTYQSVLPRLVPESQLLDANSRLQMSQSIARGSGPALGGVLVQWLSAPIAVALDAISYLASAVAAAAMRVTPPTRTGTHPAFLRQIAEGVTAIIRHPARWRLAGAEATDNFFGSGVIALYAYYATRDLGLSPFFVGLAFAVGPLGAVASSVVLSRLGSRVGPRECMIVGIVVRAVGYALTPLAGGPTAVVVVVLAAGQLLTQAGLTALAPAAVTWRQYVTPDHLLGRVLSSGMVVQYGTIPLGALFAGTLSELVSVRAVLVISAIGVFATLLWMLGAPNPDRSVRVGSSDEGADSSVGYVAGDPEDERPRR